MTSIKEVAKAAGVSKSTVSNVFVGRVPVREETRQKVLRAAERLDYRPHALAQALRYGHSRMLGFCATFLSYPNVAAMVHGGSRCAYDSGFGLMICAVEDSPDLERSHLRVLEELRVAAVVAYAATDNAEPYLDLQRQGIPVVFLNERPQGIVADLVTADFAQGVHLAVRHLLETGRRRIAILVGTEQRATTVNRLAGYYSAHAEAGLDVDRRLVCIGLRTPDDAHAAMKELLRCEPDAIVAGTSLLAIGAIDYLVRESVRVPDEVALVGTGDARWANLLQPPLTMVEFSAELVGRRAVEMAIERINPPAELPPAREVRLPATLVVRGSSVPVVAGHSERK